jgi:hypothetical protein
VIVHTCSPDACACSESGDEEARTSTRQMAGTSAPSQYDVWFEAYTKLLVSRETTDPRY